MSEPLTGAISSRRRCKYI